jgi:hypothetical protein
METHAEFIRCRKSLAISVIDCDAQVCQIISKILIAQGHDVRIFLSRERFILSGALNLAEMLILGSMDVSIGGDASFYSAACERPDLPTIIIRKHGVEAGRLATIRVSEPYASERPNPCERLTLLWFFMCRTGVGLSSSS